MCVGVCVGGGRRWFLLGLSLCFVSKCTDQKNFSHCIAGLIPVAFMEKIERHTVPFLLEDVGNHSSPLIAFLYYFTCYLSQEIMGVISHCFEFNVALHLDWLPPKANVCQLIASYSGEQIDSFSKHIWKIVHKTENSFRVFKMPHLIFFFLWVNLW